MSQRIHKIYDPADNTIYISNLHPAETRRSFDERNRDSVHHFVSVDAILAAYQTIAAHEEALLKELLAGLAELNNVKVWGITDPNRLMERAPTVSFTHAKRKPQEVAEYLASKNIFCWHGNFYALPLTEHLHLEPEGMVRVGLLHYNTHDEVQRLLMALRELE